MKHTKGPWAQYDGDPLIIVNSEGSSLGEMSAGDPYIAEAEMQANARLTAAAPDLLAAAQRSLQGWENAVELGLIPTRYTDTATSLASDLRAAIAKATGKQEG